MGKYFTSNERLKAKRQREKAWREAHPNYQQEWRKKNKKKTKPHARKHYLNKRDQVLAYYAKRNSKSEVKLLVQDNLNALLSMPLQDLFIFQALRMKSSSPVSLGAFFYAIKQQIFNQ
ncbi:MAG TPA: hypothetical protein VIU12_30175 [Chryseolinea sp.]